MPLFLYPREAPYPRSFLGWDGQDFRVVSVDVDGDLQADVLESALPAGAATAANQATILSRMPSWLFNYDDAYHETVTELNAAAVNHWLLTPAPGATEILVITTMVAWDVDTNVTLIIFGMRTGAVSTDVHVYRPTAVGDHAIWSGHMYVAAGYQPQAMFWGTAAGDDIHFHATGYVMNVTP